MATTDYAAHGAPAAEPTFLVTRRRLIVSCTVLMVLTNAVVLLRLPLGPVGPVLVLVTIVLVPGVFAFAALGAGPGEPFRQAYYVVLLGLLGLELVGLGANWLLPIVGIDRPLHPSRMLPVLDLLVLVLGVLAWRPLDNLRWALPAPRPRISVALPLLLPVLAAMGATSLNNNGTNAFTVVMLLGVLGAFVALVTRAEHLSVGLIVWTLYCVSAAMLLMTSLRGWGIVGHDIQIEYHVFQLAESTWHWDVSTFPDPYNACLSLTVMPTMVAGLTRMPDPYIYKACYQLLFALAPPVVFLIVRRLVGDRVGVLGVLFFVGFPTFFTDMPMLNRQEIALLFFAGMMLLLVEDAMPHALRLTAFALFGLGVILSHYSTTYSVILVLGSASIYRALLERRWVARMLAPVFRALRRRPPPFLGIRASVPLVALPVVIGIGLGAWAWGSAITHTSAVASATLTEALGQLTGGSAGAVKSTDTNASLVGGAALTPEQVVRSYVEHQEQMRSDEEPSTLYPDSSYSPQEIRAVPDSAIPLTWLGRNLVRAGVSPYSVNADLRGQYAKAIQMLLSVGILAMLFARRQELRLRGEIYAVVIASFLFLVALVLIPALSVSYGLLRAFQQGLIVLALPTALGAVSIFRVLFTERVSMALATGLSCLFFAVSVGLVAEATGGYTGQLHLHNAGAYYDAFYVRQPEVAGVDWMRANLPRMIGVQQNLESDRHGYPRLRQWDDIEGSDTLYPGLVRRQDYVFLGWTNLVLGQAIALYNNEAIAFTLPIAFFDADKDLLYDSGMARVYH